MDKLIAGLRHFREHVFWKRKEAFERSAKGQRPLAMLITCSDSRVLPDQLTQADPGDLFVHRNAGNLVPPPGGPSGESATIEYAVTALGVTDIVVCGHYRCGAVRALLHPGEAGGMPEVRGWLAHAAGTTEVMTREHANLDGEARWDRAVEVNVLVQLQNLAQHPVVAAGLSAGTLRLHAWVLRFESGDVLAYDPHGRRFTPLLDMPTVHPAAPLPPECCQPALAAPAEPLTPAPQTTPADRGWGSVLRHDLLASLVVFLVALPLCLAIARAVGVPPEAGLVTGIVGGMLVGLLAGSPLQVSGPAAGLVVILLDVVQKHGLERLGVVVALAGLLQLAAGILRLGQWFRAASPAVVTGMLAGIGVVLFAQQFHVMVDDPPAREPWRNLATIPSAVWHGIADSHAGHPEHQEAAMIGLLTLFILLAWKTIAPNRLRVVPAVLVAVLLATAVAAGLAWPVQRVAFSGLASGVRWPDPATLPAALADGAVWLAAAVVALVASAESLLCAAAVDRMHRGPRTRYDRELAAQGVGNAVCGVLGALPMTGVIVRSATNVLAGARSRYSAVFHGLWILVFVLCVPGALRLIPTAALAAILVLTGVKLVEAHAVRALWRESRAEGAICVATAVAVVSVDLLTGVALGVALSVVKLVHTFSRLRVRRRQDGAGRMLLVLEGAATFLRLPKLAAALEMVPPGETLHLDIRGLSYIDHACMTLLVSWEAQHAATGGTLVLDRETLRMRFLTARPRPTVGTQLREVAESVTREERMSNPELVPTWTRPGGVAPLGLFFLSGAAALVYEVSWSRLAGLALGNTAAAAAVVLAGFFAGLAAGQLLGGCLARRVRPLLGYGIAEFVAAAWAALVPMLLPPAGADGGVLPDASPAARAAWCFAALLPATVALGATLPFMAAHFSRGGGSARRLTIAYALNTAGGLVGVVGATAVLLVVVGVRASGYVAAAVSAACGLAACLLAVRRSTWPGPLAPNAGPNEPGVPPIWWCVAAVSGFGTLGLEVLYIRLFALVFHNSSYTFGAVVAVFLAGLSGGAALIAALGSRVSPRAAVAVSASLGAAAVAASVVLFVRLTGLEYFAAGDTFAGYLSHALGLVAAVVLPPAVILGMALPAALAGAGGTGRAVGRLAALNTAVAVGGALTAGFVLPRWVGLWESFGLFVLLFGATGAAMLYTRRWAAAATGVSLLTAVAATFAASGQAFIPPMAGEEVVRRWDTAYGWIDVVRNTKDGSLTVRQNLHYRHGSTGRTAVREYRQGRLPLLLHPRPADVAFLGLGTGLTAAPVITDRDVERAAVVELIPEVVEAARLLSPANLGVFDHPKVEVRVDDARHYIARTDRRFDVIVSDLFVPWESRTGYLYTVEFYRTARSRLKPGGLFCQWLALYQVGAAEFELVADSFAAVFPNVTLWWGQFDARFAIVALVGSDAPLELDPDRLIARWSAAGETPGGADPELSSGATAPQLFLGRWPARPSNPLNTDEHPRLEFQAPVSQRSGLALQGEKLRSYFDRVLVNLPQGGVRLLGDWSPTDREPARRRERQRLGLFGPDG